MFLDSFLTDYDDSLTGESYIDPLGMLVVWSAYGQRIFKNRVNSISNDVRNYTLNLFNHHLVRRLVQDDDVVLKPALSSVYGGKDSLQFKYACLIYLENIFVYSLLEQEGSQGIDVGGVLGITKARRTWEASQHSTSLVFSHDSISHILVRQLSLGVSGRYKTPFMEIGYFDGSYHYQMPSAAARWAETESLFATTPALGSLANAVYPHLHNLLAQNSSRPEIAFSSVIAANLPKLYADAFSSPGVVGRYARTYWLAATGLDRGAAGALLQVLDKNAASSKACEFDAQQFIAAALNEPLESNEQMKLQHIEWLEPFLADCSLLFTLLVSKKSQTDKEVVRLWKQYCRDDNTLPSGAQRAIEHPDVLEVLSGTARFRLQALLKLRNAPTVSSQIRLLVEYHNKVMEGRGQSSWLNVDEQGVVKVHARTVRAPKIEDWPLGRWTNGYYLPQFRSLVVGYQGGQV